MAITPVPPLTDIPTFPALSDRAAGDYNGMAFAFARHMSDKFVQEIVPVAASAVSNATDAQASALLATQARDQTQADRVATGQDRTATAADRVQTNLDKLAAQAAAAQAGTTGAFSDANPVVKGASDATKQWRLNVSNLPAGVQRVNTPPSRDGQLVTKEELASSFFNRAKSIDTSGNFVAEVSGPHRITLIGAPGSGGLAAVNDGNGSTDSAAAATGGATGGIAIKNVVLQAGDSLAVVIGAPGAQRSYVGVGPINFSGVAGGQSRVTGAGVALIANGGGGGFATVTTNNTAAVALGATGGTASGGDINITGCDSGTATASPNIVSTTKYAGAAATGGAGVPYYGQRFTSGTATTTGGAAATGGASPSGSSGSVNSASSGMGASGGAGTSGSANVTNGAGAPGPGLPTFSVAGFSLTGNGGSGSTAPSTSADGAGNGGAGGGYAFRPASAIASSWSAGSSGLFAGSGAAAIARNPIAGNVVNAGVPGRGGASGAVAVVTTNTSMTLLVPAAGSSVCIIEYYQEPTA